MHSELIGITTVHRQVTSETLSRISKKFMATKAVKETKEAKVIKEVKEVVPETPKEVIAPPKNRRKSIVLRGSQPPQIYRTYRDWQETQKQDTRTAHERGIQVGSPVLWRHKEKHIIVTDRALVTEISPSGKTLTLQVKGVKDSSVSVHVREIVIGEDTHLSMREMNQRTYLMSLADGSPTTSG